MKLSTVKLHRAVCALLLLLASATGKAQSLALKTNMLYDAVLIPNVGVEVSLGKQWTASADWFYTWFSSDSRHRYWQGYGGYLTVRRYLASNSKLSSQRHTLTERTLNSQLLKGHHLGAYVLGMTYDVEWGGRGYQADHFGFGAGLEYGYALPISNSLLLDFSLGIGFQDGEYKEYEPQGNRYVWQATRQRHWFGPTKAEVTLKWLLGKKGGGK